MSETKETANLKTNNNSKKQLEILKNIGIIYLLLILPPVGIFLFIKFMKKPSRKTRIAISLAWIFVWVFMIMIFSVTDNNREIEINGEKVSFGCYDSCYSLESAGGESVIKELVKAGIKSTASSIEETDDGKFEFFVNEATDNKNKVVMLAKNGKLTKIYSSLYPTIIYYSSNNKDKTFKYPATEEMKRIDEEKIIDIKPNTESVRSASDDDYMNALRKCTVMEAADIYNNSNRIGAKSNNVFNNARKHCESIVSKVYKHDEKTFISDVNIDWSTRKNEVIEGKYLTHYLNVLGW